MDFENLITQFKNYNLSALSNYEDLISTKTQDGRFFPPYIPYVGKYYEKFKILEYATAQNINIQ